MIQVVILTTFIIVPVIKFFGWCFDNYILAPTLTAARTPSWTVAATKLFAVM